MSEENTTPETTPENNDAPNDTIAKLQEQIANLNKGIATYRDEVSQANSKVASLSAEIEKLSSQKAIDKAVEDADLSPEEQKKFDAWAKKNGYVTQKDLAKEKEQLVQDQLKQVEQTAVAEFLEKYPELDNDEDWKKITDEFSLYNKPTNIAGYRQLLERVRKSVAGETTKSDDEALAKAKAKIKSKSDLSRTGVKGQGSSASALTNDARIEELREKYPNLSEDQIRSTLKDLDTLYEEKDN